jgi:hypothetical protein
MTATMATMVAAGARGPSPAEGGRRRARTNIGHSRGQDFPRFSGFPVAAHAAWLADGPWQPPPPRTQCLSSSRWASVPAEVRLRAGKNGDSLHPRAPGCKNAASLLSPRYRALATMDVNNARACVRRGTVGVAFRLKLCEGETVRGAEGVRTACIPYARDAPERRRGKNRWSSSGCDVHFALAKGRPTGRGWGEPRRPATLYPPERIIINTPGVLRRVLTTGHTPSGDAKRG